ncbi:glutamate synthase large subunit [Luteimonas gilva]|uniref:Glutamate synthase large subunit n=1 Tax=Luteimonas gilva TaxID=2572684 RepID=A0A4U5JKS2_9GAMM|nr:glutamate synthase large subunit [Luteimonas gilva]TKR30200.1 glutamate synthase large subunit [Luteimonas gilva]
MDDRQSRTGLYDPRDERDSCGFGLIAQLDDRPSRDLVEHALEALGRMTHRGGVAADGLSGDGCGLLIKRPDAFLRALAAEAGIALGVQYAAGLVFLPHDETDAAKARAGLAQALREVGLAIAGWRIVPLDESACGASARRSLPRIEQVFVGPALDVDGARPEPAAFQRGLYLARRRAEQRIRGELPDFYIVTLSADSVGYKGMVLPSHLPRLYPDLRRADLASSAVVFHQRFSTNTSSRWSLAQPFRLLAHNGEINTIAGNRRWAQARAAEWRTDTLDPREFDPVIEIDGSDSQSLDSMLELLQAGGMDLLKAMRILIPPATQSLEYKDADLAAFYEYYALNTEPWDGPAGIVVFDGRYAACTLDRNGLRPARWLLSRDRHFLVASEAGVWELPTAEIEAKGKLGPGQMIAADLHTGELLDSDAIDAVNRARAPYKRWLKQGMTYLHSELIDPALAAEPFDHGTLAGFQKLFQLTREEREQVLRPLAETEQEAIGSMGDDVPMAALSQHVRPLYDRFRQAFAQVTNPPIDPLREDCVMSLATQIGREGNVFVDGPDVVHHVLLNSPVMSQRKVRQLLSMAPYDASHRYIDLNFAPEEGLRAALERICAEAEEAARAGVLLLILSDRRPRRDHLMLHALLATGAVHQHLVRIGLRCAANLIVETGTARDPHHFACLVGFGATAVYPYLAYQTLHDLGVRGILKTKHGGYASQEPAQIGRSYRRGVKKGLLKIISKMGISTIGSYRGAQLFEIVGLDREVVELCFAGTPSRIGGAGFDALQAEAAHLAALGWDNNALPEIGGLLQYTPEGEYHQFNPDVVMSLQRAVRSGDAADWKRYADTVNSRPPAALRDLLAFDTTAVQPVPLDEVEPIEAIVKRFDTAAMSLGALSPEAHEALAIAMNRLGGRSNSGEGGEDPVRYRSEKTSKIKQIASGRFGVTPEYLVNAEVLQIKMAQGAKPGEGGQLPGHKVNELIARLRYARPGIGLISPPPHHDIYSIEDLAQLIFDLKQVNPDALVSVKLVSHAGVGTIATGVAKAGADLITISGHDGGTGASPLSSIRYAGTPWELGLSEARQALLANDLRERVIVQADGGLKTGLDVIKAALLGAESFGFGTAPMIALGCKYLRICHLNNCATGVATQDERLRENHFSGLPERVENFFRGLAEEVRGYLAQLGARTLDEIVGRVDLLRQIESGYDAHRHLDLSPLLAVAATHKSPPALLFQRRENSNGPRTAVPPPLQKGDRGGFAENVGSCGAPALVAEPNGLSVRLETELADPIAEKRGGRFEYPIRNTDRSIGARLSGRIARLHGNLGMNDAPIELRFDGTAGQSFGAFLAGGLQLELHGEANDYVGKGMAGGRIVVRPPANARYAAHEAPILGNTCLYGATGGELYAAGQAGERFAVRNSGTTAVVEGVGDHCCEYMTGGTVAVLGRTGLNFGAGFTGGMAYVLDLDRDFVDRYNHELIDILRINSEGFAAHRSHLLDLIETHARLTGSAFAQRILEEFRDFLGKFWLVKPKAASLESLADNLRRAA